MQHRVLSTKAVHSDRLGISRSAFYKDILSDPRFPRPIRLTKQRIGYLESEIDAFIALLAAERDDAAA